MSNFPKIILSALAWFFFALVILKVPYPQTLTSANVLQLLAFFISLFLSLTFSLNIFIKSLPRSISLSFGVIIILILKALGSLNLVLVGLTLISIVLLFSYFKKKPKLTPRSNVPKMRNLSKRKKR